MEQTLQEKSETKIPARRRWLNSILWIFLVVATIGLSILFFLVDLVS